LEAAAPAVKIYLAFDHRFLAGVLVNDRVTAMLLLITPLELVDLFPALGTDPDLEEGGGRIDDLDRAGVEVEQSLEDGLWRILFLYDGIQRRTIDGLGGPVFD